MGLWEMLDKACAALLEAGYLDPWSWTPRQVMHRLEVHQWLRSQENLRQLEIGILASRGEKNQVEEFLAKTKATHAVTAGHDETLSRRPAPDAVVTKLADVHRALPWDKRERE